MQKYQSRSLAIVAYSVILGACSSSGTSSSETTVSNEEIEFIEVIETLEVPIESVVDGVEQATGFGFDAGLLYILTNNQRVVVFTEEAEFFEQFDIPMLGTVSAQALSAENEQLAVIDSQGQLYLRQSGEEAVEVISYNYPATQELDFAALAYAENGDWQTVNRSGEKNTVLVGS